jgi:MoaA/NifB/PqqE/SkfB family radical SAM enzyme
MRRHENFTCWAGQLIFNIDTDGRIAACDVMSHMRKDNPNVLKGLKKAIGEVKKDCEACTCAHVIEYNYMFSFKPDVVWDWARMVFGKQ